MEIQVDNKKYEIVVASSDDGMGCELWDLQENRLLIEIFRDETLKELQFYSAEINIPLSLLETTLQHFNSRVGTDFK
jgi:hypothetical protein